MPENKKSFLAKIFFSFLLVFNLNAQTPNFDETIYINIWSELDAYPELAEAQDTESGIFDYSSKRLKDTAPFLINGMVYGWNFVYTPYDKTRGVKEYLEISPVNQINQKESPITYENPWIQDNLIHIWTKYERTKSQVKSFRAWKTINTQKTQGTGTAPVKTGFEGISEATKNAIRDGIRSFYRPIIKNKPKEISGRIIIAKEPKIGITQGQYSVKLDFFLETDRIIKYTMF